MPMRQVRYNVAASLDGYIAGPAGEFDWIPADPAVDFATLFARVDTVLLGRRSYELTQQTGAPPWAPGMRVYVFSRTLRVESSPGITIVGEDAGGVVAALRAELGEGEIWLFGGGELFRSLLTAGQVDAVEVTIVPVLLGGGIPLLPPGTARTSLALTNTRTYPSGMVTLSYTVHRAAV
ncbi:MAG TPA: dihydrofolate reductase family protein [Dehalococcoidia bacterium]